MNSTKSALFVCKLFLQNYLLSFKLNVLHFVGELSFNSANFWYASRFSY